MPITQLGIRFRVCHSYGYGLALWLMRELVREDLMSASDAASWLVRWFVRVEYVVEQAHADHAGYATLYV